jgi:hypothetical protein
MTILKFFTLFLICYIAANASWWAWQEHIHYEDTQSIKSLRDIINVDASIIEEKRQDLEKTKINLTKEKETLDELLSRKKTAQYNELVPKYNKSIDQFNAKKNIYDTLVDTHNTYVRQINELINKSGTRTFLFPIQPYKKPLFEELK